MITEGSGSEKTNALANLINNKPGIDKIYIYPNDPYEAKYQLLVKKKESTGLKYFNDSKSFMSTQMIWMVFIKILKNTIQKENQKF